MLARSLSFLAAFFAITSLASAKSTFDAQLFSPAPGVNGFFTTESGDVNKHLQLNLDLVLDYTYKPLTVHTITNGNDSETGSVIENRLDAHFSAALGLFDWADIGVVLPIVFQGGFDSSTGIGLEDPQDFVLGDLHIVPKVRLLHYREGLLSLAVIPAFTLPTGDASAFAGEKSATFAPAVAVSTTTDVLRFGANFGYILRENTQVFNLTVGDEMFYKFAGALNLTADRDNPFEIVIELHGRTPASSPFEFTDTTASPASPVEIDLGVKTLQLGWLKLAAGVGTGLSAGYNTPVLRMFTSAGIDFGVEEENNDWDGDGILNHDDACPHDPEDFDGFEDEDGCPELDNDLDGILDPDDMCPETPPEERFKVDAAGCTITVEKIGFKFNSAELLPSSGGTLDFVVSILEYKSHLRVRIEGHTDSIGTAEYNLDLSARRAKAVEDYLIEHGMDASRLDTVGFGEEKPIADNKTAKGREANRRVEFIVIKFEEE